MGASIVWKPEDLAERPTFPSSRPEGLWKVLCGAAGVDWDNAFETDQLQLSLAHLPILIAMQASGSDQTRDELAPVISAIEEHLSIRLWREY